MRAFIIFSKSTSHVIKLATWIILACRVDAWLTQPAGNCEMGKVKGQQEIRGLL